ncbi:MAG: hypothetical protein CSA65_00310 [Proteobacteria bacterium]|nr:MAG: hypothetical protein CSA65_00310 [Pseudomonadota bacterium]
MKTTRRSFAFALATLVALSATNVDARRYRRPVAKVGPNVVRQSSLTTLRQRINLELGTDRIVAHVQHIGRRKASLAFAKTGGKPQRLDLQRLLPQIAAPLQRRVTHELAKLSQKPAATWLNSLQKTITHTQNAELRTALTACANEMERLGSAGRPADWQAQEQARFEKRFARKLLRHQSGSTAWLLPQEGLPALPASTNPQVVAELKKLPPRASNAMKVARLERVAATLLGSAKAKDQRRGKAVRSYLASYKRDSWVDAFLDKQLSRFSKETGMPWKLGDNVSWQYGVSAADKRVMRQRLTKAWSIARGAVHPDLLAWTLAVKVEVDPNASGASHQGDTIRLRPDSSVKDILHELGHHIEDYGGLRTIAGAHGILDRRAFGGAMKPITEIDPTGTFGSYAPGTLAHAGAFERPYMGKVYQNGSTEVMSVALEKLADRQAAKQFFKRDGDHFLQMLNAMQRKPWPMVD